eukprot:CAMPEP_0168579770 /NCGR_PEP_ID=MMETSP0420-20121227/414_1 /TAXON_ID=498008 /ORGANISM="Pessonella sp." /LENGTH=72 /DNA_ID=CAMNT_0008613789 /DNA_START=118 /DNA_END=333 /DNA_ORIENTATION=-
MGGVEARSFATGKYKLKTKSAMKKRYRIKKSGRVEFHPKKMICGRYSNGVKRIQDKQTNDKLASTLFHGPRK